MRPTPLPLMPQGEFETGFERGGQTREHAQVRRGCSTAGRYAACAACLLKDPAPATVCPPEPAPTCAPCLDQQLAKTLGVTKLVVAINKMDDHSVLDGSGKW